MNNIDFRANAAAEASIQAGSGGNGKQGQGDVASQFMEILSKARLDVQGGLGLTATQSNFNAMPERKQVEAPRDDHPADRREPKQETREVRDRDNDYGRDRTETARDDRAERDDRAAAPDRRDDRAEDRSEQHDDKGHRDDHAEAHDDHKAKADDQKTNSAYNSQDKTAKTDDKTASDTDTGKTETTGEPHQAAETAKAEAAEKVVDTIQDDPTLAAIAAAMANANTQTTKTDQPQQTAAAGPMVQEAAKVEGPARPDGHIGQQWQANNPDPSRLPGAQAQTASQNGQAQAQAHAAEQAQGKLDTAFDPSKANASRQAAEMSRMVGEGNRISVQTEVASESDKLVSRPNANLANTSILAGDGSKQAQSTAQNGQTSLALGGLHAGQQQAAQQAALGAGNAQQGQVQQAAAQAAQQIASNGAGAEAKGPAAPTMQPGTMGQAAQGMGGEGQAAAQSTTSTHNTTPTQQSQNAQNAHQPRFTLPGQAVTDQVNVQITKALQNGLDKIEIHLKPAHLGRVDVSMELSHDGRVQAVVSADNKNTLELLQRDARDLQQALQDAGLQTDSGSLSFNLREQHGEGAGNGGSGGSGPGGDVLAEGDLDGGLDEYGAPYDGGIISDDRVDIRA